MDFCLLMELRDFLTIKHHVAGRIRIQFSMKLLGDPRAQMLKDNASGITPPPCIKNTKLNLFARTVVIDYDPAILEPEKLHEALTTSDEVRFKELAAELETILAV